jgi:hypothetical protein
MGFTGGRTDYFNDRDQTQVKRKVPQVSLAVCFDGKRSHQESGQQNENIVRHLHGCKITPVRDTGVILQVKFSSEYMHPAIVFKNGNTNAVCIDAIALFTAGRRAKPC